MSENKKGLSTYIKYPLVLTAVCLVCGGALATINYFTEPVISENNEKAANQALYDMAAKEGLNVENIADIPYEDGANNPYVLVRKSFDSGDSVYYYYNANSAMGYSGTVNFSVLANSDAEVISFTYISGTEDSLGLSAARAISITSNNPYAEGSSIANYSAGATAQKTFPAIDTALDFIISDVQSIAGSVTPPEPETLETKITSLATSIDLGAVSDITEVTTEAASVDLKATFTAGGASYYYYEAHSEKGFSGSVEFALIINSESEIIGYKYLGGDEDSMGLGAAQTIEITPDHPFTSESTIDSSYASSTAQATFPVMEAAFKACIADASSQAGEASEEEQAQELAESIGLTDISNFSQVTITSTTIDYKATFTAGGASYYYYEAHSDAEAGWSGSVEFALIINSENEIIGYKYLGGDEDGLGLAAAQTIEITPDHPFTSESTIDSSYASATAKKTFPAMEAAFKACIADASSAQ